MPAPPPPHPCSRLCHGLYIHLQLSDTSVSHSLAALVSNMATPPASSCLGQHCPSRNWCGKGLSRDSGTTTMHWYLARQTWWLIRFVVFCQVGQDTDFKTESCIWAGLTNPSAQLLWLLFPVDDSGCFKCILYCIHLFFVFPWIINKITNSYSFGATACSCNFYAMTYNGQIVEDVAITECNAM